MATLILSILFQAIMVLLLRVITCTKININFDRQKICFNHQFCIIFSLVLFDYFIGDVSKNNTCISFLLE
jgi:hypothetical protein